MATNQFFNMSKCEQTAAYLLDIMPIVLAIRLRPRGGNIVTCGVARSSQNLLRIDLAFCCECGSADLEACCTSKALGPHLCSICAKLTVECGRGEESRSADDGAACVRRPR